MENRVDRQTAEAEFERFGEMMDRDFDTEGMTEEEQSSFGRLKRQIVRAIMRGSLVIDDKGQPIFTPQRTEWDGGPITFYEWDGATIMACDRHKKGQTVHQMYAMLANMTKQGAGKLSRLRGSDAEICQALFALFLA